MPTLFSTVLCFTIELFLTLCSLIRDSAPIINTIIIGGCVLMLVTCYLLGVDTQTPSLDGDDPAEADEDNIENDMESINDRRNARYASICNVCRFLPVILDLLLFPTVPCLSSSLWGFPPPPDSLPNK